MENVSYEDFAKVDLRIGKIISAEPIEESEKLIKLQVDLGEDKPRQILAGIKKNYSADELVNKNIVVVANLEPRKLMGIESQGMLLAASTEGGEPVLLTSISEIDPGAKVK